MDWQTADGTLRIDYISAMGSGDCSGARQKRSECEGSVNVFEMACSLVDSVQCQSTEVAQQSWQFVCCVCKSSCFLGDIF